MWTWRVSLALAAGSLVIALGLTVKRWFEELALNRAGLRRTELSTRIYALLAAPREPTSDMLPPLQPGDPAQVLTIALDILRSTRGADALRMVQLVRLFEIKPYLDKALRKGPRPLKIRVLTLLARFDDPESLAHLRAHLGDPSMYVQLAALRGIADRGDLDSLRGAVVALATARETNAPLLADILRRFGDSAVPSITLLAHSGGAHAVRLAAIRALGSIGALSAFGDLADLANEPHPALRAEALAALGKLGDTRALPDVIRALQAREDSVRAEAAIAAGLLGGTAALSALTECLGDPAWQVRYRAAEALHRIGAAGIAVLKATSRRAVGGEVGAAAAAAEMATELLAEKEGIAP